MSRTTKAAKYFLVGFLYLMYAGAVIYGDVMFLQIVSVAFPQNGFLQSLAFAGAIVTAGTALALPAALHFWFAPGAQFVWGVIYWLADVVILGLNSILAYQLATNSVDSFFLAWRSVSPATPLFAVIGVGTAFLLDPSHAKRHAEMEGELDQLDIYRNGLNAAADSPEVKAELVRQAKLAAQEYAQTVYRVPIGENGHKPQHQESSPKS